MSAKRLSTRSMLVLVSFITAVLLFGSVLLQRIVFKADQAASAIFISPAASTIRSGQELTLRLNATFDRPATVSAAQFQLTFDSTRLNVKSLRAVTGWEAAYRFVSDNTATVILTPDQEGGAVRQLAGETTFAEVVIIANADGVATVAFDETKTKIVALDPSQSPSQYNAVNSTQAAALSVSDQALLTPSLTEDIEPNDTTTASGSFRSLEVLVGQSSAAVLIGADEPATVSVDFGLSPGALITTVRGTKAERYSMRRLNDLQPDTKYFYRVRLENENGETVISRTRAFTTAANSKAAAKLAVFPRQAKTETVAYLTAPGAVVPKVSLLQGEATLGPVTGSGGVYQVTITSKLPSRQSVALGLVGEESARAEAIFDPNYTEPAAVVETAGPIPATWPVKLLLGILALSLVALTLLFIRLTRVK